jgi:2-dehydropantoate 2-reductase
MTAPGRVKHSGRGDLILGSLRPHSPRATLERIAAVFERAGVPCKLSENIAGDLWVKLALNCAYNAVSALTRSRYGRITRDAGTREVMRRVTEETLAVARAAGIEMPAMDLLAAVFKLGEAMPNALSSTAQDIERGKRTEIDSLNGYVVRRGGELGVPTPVNQTLCALIKLLEERA